MKMVESQTSELYEDIHPYSDQEYTIDIYLRTLGIEESFFKGKKVLDCGFGGTGWGVRLFSRGGAKLVAGIDLNQKWVAKAQAELAALGAHTDLRQGSILNLPFEDNTFDYVHSFGVIHHTTDWRRAIAEMVRVAKPGAIIFFMVYGMYALPGKIINGCYRIAGRIIPYRWMASFVKHTGFLRSSDLSILDVMYVPIELHFSEDKLHHYLVSLGIQEIRFFESEKWKHRKVFKWLFGNKINHNVWAIKPLTDSQLGNL